MGRPILMPKLGLTMTEGVLAEWKIAPGDHVRSGDVIFVVETDKVSNEIQAAESGVIEALRVQPGDVVPVGGVVATLVAQGASPEPPPFAAGASVIEATLAAPPPAATARRVVATPLARRLAANAGVEIGAIRGSGPRGRIVAADVSAALQAQPPSCPAPHAAAGVHGRLRPLGSYQQVAARRLTEAKREIPHFYVFAEADVTELLQVRAGLNADPALAKVSVTHFIIAAVARALAATPEVNCVWAEEGLLELPTVDVGVAVDGPKGLVAPVLHDLAGATLDEVAQAAAAVVERARAGRLAQDDLQGGATSISNVGMFGATGLLPIINPGQSSILGVGRNQPVFRPDAQGQPCLRQALSLSLSCDHRVIDGALAARFLQTIQHGLEAPLTLLRRPSRGTAA